MIQLLTSHLVCVIYFDSSGMSTTPFSGIIPCTWDRSGPGSKHCCTDTSQPAFLPCPHVLFLHEAVDFPIRLQICMHKVEQVSIRTVSWISQPASVHLWGIKQFVLSLFNFKHMWAVSVQKILSWIKLLYSAPQWTYLERCKYMWAISVHSSGGVREISKVISQCDFVCTRIYEDLDFHS